MMFYGLTYLATAVVFFGLDFIWLSRVATGFYKARIGGMMLAEPNLAAAGVFYLAYIGGIVYFAVLPAVSGNGSLGSAALAGALLGLMAYGTYDMTNLATLKGWSIQLAAVDMAWGMVLTALAASAGYLAAVRLAA